MGNNGRRKPSRTKELIKTTGILMVAKFSTQVVSFLLLPLYTALLSTAEYGEIDIYASLAMIIVPFLTLQLEMGLFRFFILSDENETRYEIVCTSAYIVTAILFMMSIAYIIVTIFVKVPYRWEILAYCLVNAIIAVMLQLCRAEGKTIVYSLASFMSSALTIVFNVLFVAFLHINVRGILLSTIIAQMFGIVFLIWKTDIIAYLKQGTFKKDKAKELLNYSVPLVFNQIASWAINYSDRLIILGFWGIGQNGIYSLACKFSNIVNTFFGVYSVAWNESAVRSINDTDRQKYISNIFNMTFYLYIFLITGIINVLPFAFSILVNSAYSDAYPHIPILLLGMFFSGMAGIIGSVYVALGKTKTVSITTILAGLCNLAVHFLLLNNGGLFAASISTLVSFGLLFIYRIIFIRKHIKINFEFTNMIYIVFFVTSWIAFLLKYNWLIITMLIINLTIFSLRMHKIKEIVKKRVKE